MKILIIGAVAAGTSSAAKARRNSEDVDIKIFEMDSDISYCNKGVTGNAAQNILINKGFKHVYNLSGGHKNYAKVIKDKKEKE